MPRTDRYERVLSAIVAEARRADRRTWPLDERTEAPSPPRSARRSARELIGDRTGRLLRVRFTPLLPTTAHSEI